jgi:trehalose 6-phosphate synthase/phosphatase
MPIDLLHGHRVLEIRAAGVSKGGYVEQVVRGLSPDTFVLCVGDDRTDSDMYRVLPPGACSIHVGSGTYETRYRIESPAQVRAFLRELHGQVSHA